MLSAGALVGGAVAGRLGSPVYLQGEWGLEALYGVQTRRFEWVALASLAQRSVFNEVGGHPLFPVVRSNHLGLTLGLFRRDPAGWALQLGYLGDLARFDHGVVLLQYGVFWDL